MHDDHTDERRKLRAAMSVGSFKSLLIGVAREICQQAEDRNVRYRNGLQALEKVLPPRRFIAVHDAIEEIYLPSFSNDSAYAGKEKEELRQIARFSIIADFEDFLMVCLRQDFPDLFMDVLRLLTKVPALKATEFTRQEQLCLERNPLAYLWAIVIAFTKGTPVEDSLGYKEVAGKPTYNTAHMLRATKFLRTLKERYQQVEQTDAARQADETPSHPITLILDNETWKKLDLIVAKYGGKKSREAVAESLLRGIINRILAKDQPT